MLIIGNILNYVFPLVFASGFIVGIFSGKWKSVLVLWIILIIILVIYGVYNCSVHNVAESCFAFIVVSPALVLFNFILFSFGVLIRKFAKKITTKIESSKYSEDMENKPTELVNKDK